MNTQQPYTTAASNPIASSIILDEEYLSTGRLEDRFPVYLEKKVSEHSTYESSKALHNTLLLAADLEWGRAVLSEQVKQLQKEAEENSHKMEFYDYFANSNLLHNLHVASKTVGTGKTRLLIYLRKHKVLMGGGYKHNLPYQKHIDAGRLEVKWTNGIDRKTGERFCKPVPLFTGKGVLWLKNFIDLNGRQGL
jgi:phage antirepressor YoqD-like protein